MRLALGLRTFDLTARALVVGMIDVSGGTPAPGGVEALLERVEQLVGEGADVVEVRATPAGGPSAGNSEAEELDAVVPVVGALHERLDVPVSCATTRAAVARAAFAAGAVMGSDASGFADPDYVPAAVAAGAAVVAGHPKPEGPGVVRRVEGFLAERGRRAATAGLPPERIVVDPGLDRCADSEPYLELLGGTPALARLGHPLLVSVPASPFPDSPAGTDHQWGPAAVAAVAVVGGARLLRTGDVRAGRRVADVVAAILAAP
jgi:dihydropteroate synthase